MTTLALNGRFYRISLAALPDAPMRARRFLRDQLTLWGLPTNDDTAESAYLALSETVTNATRATGRDTGPVEPLPCETVATIEVRVAASCTDLMVEVWDNSPAMPVATDAADDQEHGRGVSIVIALADAYGCRPETLPPATTPGKAVWFTFKRDFAPVTPVPAAARPAVPAQRPESTGLQRRTRQISRAPTPAVEPDPLSVWATGPEVLARLYTVLRAIRPAHWPSEPRSAEGTASVHDVEAVVRGHTYPLSGVAGEERVRQHILNAYRCWGEPDPARTFGGRHGLRRGRYATHLRSCHSEV